MLLFFKAFKTPFELALAALKIEIVASTKPNKIPETVEMTPADVRMSLCCIKGTYFNNKYVKKMLPIIFAIYLNNINYTFLMLMS